MAKITRRTWTSRGPNGRRVRKVAYGYSLVVAGRQERKYDSAWSREDAEQALAARVLEREAPERTVPAVGLTFHYAVERYLAARTRRTSLGAERGHLARLTTAFGADTPLAGITASRISEYKVARLAGTVRRGGEDRPLAPATLNRELARLRHLLRVAHEEWEVIDKVPRLKLEREPQGRLRYLSAEEEVRLFTACSRSQNKDLLAIVTVALNTGMRKGEIMGLTWELDFSRNVIRLEITKSGRRREIPVRDVVYRALSERPGGREGRVWRDRNLRKAFETAAAAAALDDFRFHDLRHSFASSFMMRDGSPRGAPRDPRPRDHGDDAAVQPPVAGPPARRDGAHAAAGCGNISIRSGCARLGPMTVGYSRNDCISHRRARFGHRWGASTCC